MSTAADQIVAIDRQQAAEYAAHSEKISAAVVALMKQDGWQIFLTTYAREKDRIKEKDDYATLEDFKADRRAIGIVDTIIETFKGYVEDAEAAAETMRRFAADDLPKDRGIMLLDAQEGATLEG